MSQRMTWDELVRGLRAAGVPKMIAEARANAELGMFTESVATLDAPVTFPILLTVPWSGLISDNDKYAPALAGGRPVIILQADYREAKKKATERAREAMGDAAALTMPLMLIGRIYVPDNRAGHDVCNFAKCLLDAMEKIIYRNDDQLHRVTWVRAGVDVDAPRCEIEINKL